MYKKLLITVIGMFAITINVHAGYYALVAQIQATYATASSIHGIPIGFDVRTTAGTPSVTEDHFYGWGENAGVYSVTYFGSPAGSDISDLGLGNELLGRLANDPYPHYQLADITDGTFTYGFTFWGATYGYGRVDGNYLTLVNDAPFPTIGDTTYVWVYYWVE